MPSVWAYRVVLERLDRLRGRGDNLSDGRIAATRSPSAACIAASPAVAAIAVCAVGVGVGIHYVGDSRSWGGQRSRCAHVCGLYVGPVAHSHVGGRAGMRL